MKNKLYILLAAFLLCCAQHVQAQIITTIAGDSVVGYCCDGGLAVEAELDAPYFVALDGRGNFYISDGDNNRIRKVNTAGIITTIAGTGVAGFSGDGGPATAAKISLPEGLKVDKYGNLYFADCGNARVRKIDTIGIITTIAGTGAYSFSGDGGPATAADLHAPHDVAIDGGGNVYITDLGNSCVRKVNISGIITTIAGIGEMHDNTGDGGPATAAMLGDPYGISLDNAGNIYVADYGNNNIRKIDADGIISTIAGIGTYGYSGDGGPATAAELKSPCGVAADNNGNLYVADVFNDRIRIISPATTTGIISTIAGCGVGAYSGDGGLATLAGMFPTGVTLDAAGNIYISDFGHGRIRYVQNTLSVNNPNEYADKINIYPSPSNGSFTVNVTSDINDAAQIIITNEFGEKIKGINTITNQPTGITIEVPPGVYFLTAITAGGKWSNKVTVY